MRAVGSWVLKLCVARGLSLWGTRITFLALPASAAAARPDSAIFVAVLEGMTVVGFLLFAIRSRLLADRVRPVRLMVVTDFARAGLLAVACLGLWSLTYSWSLASAVVVVAAIVISSCFSVVSDASTQRLVVELGDTQQRSTLNAVLYALSAAGSLVGPLIVGFLVVAAGAWLGLGMNAAALALAAVLVLLWRSSFDTRTETPADAPALLSRWRSRRREGWQDAIAGFTFLFQLPLLAWGTASVAAANLFAGIYGATYVL